MNTKPEGIRITAVIPTYNREKTVIRAIQSALDQAHLPDEIIVVDDGSTDNTHSIVKQYGNRVKYIYQKNSGASEARNRGVREASGEWISFLDSDDFWLEHHLARMVEAILATNGRANLYFADTRLPPNQGSGLLWDVYRFKIKEPYEFTEDASEWVMLSKRQPMMLQSSVIRRSSYLDVGGLWESLAVREDTHLFYKLCFGSPACAVAGCGTFMTSDDDTGSRLTSLYHARTLNYHNSTILFCRDLLTRGYPMKRAHQWQFRRTLADAHLNIARLTWKNHNFLSAAPHFTMFILTHPKYVFERLIGKLGRFIGFEKKRIAP